MLETEEEEVYCGSEKAIVAATGAYLLTGAEIDSQAFTNALIALHSPDLGLDRSVCLRDIIDALAPHAEGHGNIPDAFMMVIRFIEKEFGGTNS